MTILTTSHNMLDVSELCDRIPAWLQPLAQCVPASHVFEGMRQMIAHGQIEPYHIWCAFGLNAIYMVLAANAFKFFFEQARRRGFLAKYAA